MTDPRCVAPDSGIYPCENRPLPDAPFPLCGKHAAQILEFINSVGGFGGRPVIDPGPRPETRGVVYYLQVGKHIKIGFTSNLNRRMATYPPDSELLATEPGTFARERERHLQFAAALSMRSEWFHPAPELLAHIKAVRGLTPEDWAKSQGPMHPKGVGLIQARLARDQRRS